MNLQLSADKSEENLRSQSVILRWGEHRKYRPYAFTEQGVAILSSVLRSKRAVQVNIEIMRAFVKLRSILAGHAGLARKLDALLRVPRSLEMKDPSAPVALGKQAQGKGKQRTEVLLIRRSKRLQVALSSLGRHRQIIAGPLGQGMLL